MPDKQPVENRKRLTLAKKSGANADDDKENGR